jgi:hypothetical protein
MCVLRVDEIHHLIAVHPDADVVAFRDHVLGPPRCGLTSGSHPSRVLPSNILIQPVSAIGLGLMNASPSGSLHNARSGKATAQNVAVMQRI